ncbi:hypothetical protein NQ038_00655 [Brevibacterium sp. 50QC2O2]|jgi:hypothetical protein|uniref:hypothetical protein n=1 Tax=Brevibacterium TaxID=1696 RepID=UPI00211C8048|nr:MULTISPECIES: hypothetical protein [unclassified Brevibacterium]MCQ9386105.1 hypothetical protein [Brevibacterium sp. 68QC2CO]MCQ9387168.1 hypothetical protein [Brevibacterium sp. 50QC2O2]
MTHRLSTAILRGLSGASILNAGIEKLSLDDGSAGFLKGMAAKGFPFLDQLDDKAFGKLLAAGEIAVGGALLAPFVPNRVAGAGLAIFSAGMLTMYFRTEDFTKDDGVRPAGDGVSVSHNAWLAAIAGALLVEGKSKSAR